MAKAYIKLTEANLKAIRNFIGMCRMNGMENSADPTFTFKDQRDIGTVSFDLYFDSKSTSEVAWKMTVKVDTSVRFHDNEKSEPGALNCYRDFYKIKEGSLELELLKANFSVFAY